MAVELNTNHHAHQTGGPLPSATFTIFGATGDLSLRQLMPTLLHMESEKLFPDDFAIIAAGRRDISTEDFFALVKGAGFLPEVSDDAWQRFMKRVRYVSASFEDPDSFAKITALIGDKGQDPNAADHVCHDRFFYFATSPKYFALGAKLLDEQGLLDACSEHGRDVRLMVEKPFGADLDSAKALDRDLQKYFSEQQIYRTDHYLGKETVQNLLVVRFANGFLDPAWNRGHIDHVEISVLESDGIGTRGGTYDEVGALRDVIQNHALQLLALVAMERPKDGSAAALRDAKVKALKALKPFTARSIAGSVIRGQYAGYAADLGKSSRTETYAAVKAEIRNARWDGVPFYLRTGKRLANKVAEISVHFKSPQTGLFGGQHVSGNVFSVQMQPEEKITMEVNNKMPGSMQLHRGKLQFDYKEAFAAENPPSYERLFLDFFQGDQRLFIRGDEIAAAWKFTDSIRTSWNDQNAPLHEYADGSAGPEAATEMLKRDSRDWCTR